MVYCAACFEYTDGKWDQDPGRSDFCRAAYKESWTEGAAAVDQSGCFGLQVYDYIMQSLAKYRNMYMDVAALMRSGQQAPDLHAHHDLLASHLPASSNQVYLQSEYTLVFHLWLLV